MLDRFVFENHLGQRFVGLENGVYLNYNDLRDYSWSYESINGRISRFYRPVSKRKIPLVVVGETDAAAIDAKNRLFDLAEADIQALLPGRVYVGDYYTNGYITDSTKSNYLITKRYCAMTLTLTSDDPAWYRDQTHQFMPDMAEGDSFVGSGTDYPYDYPYDYALALPGREIVCDTAGDSAFRLLIYGPASDPLVIIGNHMYTVNGTINAGETLLIDSITKTITLTNAVGKTKNWFDARNREHYIFQPIPSGKNTVSWSGAFGFELTVIEKRSEPKWT